MIALDCPHPKVALASHVRQRERRLTADAPMLAGGASRHFELIDSSQSCTLLSSFARMPAPDCRRCVHRLETSLRSSIVFSQNF